MKDVINMSFFENPIISKMAAHDHEQVVFCRDNNTGLKAIIAIHSTVLGPSLGGVRMWNYNNEREAIQDVLRLSEAMTYKASISGLNLGGGKSVIIGNSKKEKSKALIRKFGQFIETLGGKYIAAEDVGISTKDIEYMRMETSHLSGMPESKGGGGDPSPNTAYGVYMGMKACAKECFGNDSLESKRIVVQGAGHVGTHLVKQLVKEKANVIVSDVDEEKIKKLVKRYHVESVGVNDVYDLETDIYSPCALGATLNNNTLSRLRCSIITGAANNQLANEEIHGKMVMEKGILYAPDFVINAGGLINCYSEVIGYSKEYVFGEVENIYNSVLKIIKKSKKDNLPDLP
jgi:leucine dehydrogenase